MKKRTGMVAGLIFSALFVSAQKPVAQPARYNVLFIAVDDLRPELGCYGSTVHSPSIDKLASAGVFFKKSTCSRAHLWRFPCQLTYRYTATFGERFK